MKKTYLIMCTALLLTLFMFSTSQAIVVYQNLGTGAPPSAMGGYTLMPFDTAPQAAIADSTYVTTIPGSPILGDLTVDTAVRKLTVPSSWSTWSHSYTGPVFFRDSGLSIRLYLPPLTGAFYSYAEPNVGGAWNVTAITNSGTTSGPIAVEGASGATGFGFYTTDDDEYIAYIDISADAGSGGFALAEFGIAQAPFQCDGGICYFQCTPGQCLPSHCTISLSHLPPGCFDEGQVTYCGCAGPCPPPACEIYVNQGPRR